MGDGNTIQVLSTSGHTRDFFSYWLSEKKILIGSDVVGCDTGNGHIETEFLSSYEDYQSSLQKLARLGAQVICQGHGLVLTGTHARRHIPESMAQAARYKEAMAETLRTENDDIGRTVRKIKAIEWENMPWPRQPEYSYEFNTRIRANAVWKMMGNKGFQTK